MIDLDIHLRGDGTDPHAKARARRVLEQAGLIVEDAGCTLACRGEPAFVHALIGEIAPGGEAPPPPSLREDVSLITRPADPTFFT